MMPYKDIKRQKEAQQRSYLRHKTRHIEASTRNRKVRRQALIDAVIAAKAYPCTDCGVEYPSYVMDLDHVRGEKIANVAFMVHECVPLRVLQEEIAKCEVVCANCHRSRTFASI